MTVEQDYWKSRIKFERELRLAQEKERKAQVWGLIAVFVFVMAGIIVSFS